MTNARRKCEPYVVRSLTEDELKKIRLAGSADPKYWEAKHEDKQLVALFKREAKNYYFAMQAQRCCYCSHILQRNHKLFDAEHIIDKSTFPSFMFEPRNLAVACSVCNGRKSFKNVLVQTGRPDDVPAGSEAYLIVHPHWDEWLDYFFIDEFNRVRPQQQPEAKFRKAVKTIEVCGIDHQNLTRLAIYFSPEDSQVAEEVLAALAKPGTPLKKKRVQLRLLSGLADACDLAAAKAVVALLEEDIEAAERTKVAA